MTKDSLRAMLVFWWQAGVLPSTQLSNAAFAKPLGLKCRQDSFGKVVYERKK